MVPAAPKKSASKPSKAPKTKATKPTGPVVENPLPLKGKKVVGGKGAVAPPKQEASPEPAVVPPTPAPEPARDEKQLCWIELVKNGNVFIARSHTGGAAAKEYKNRVLEDMLTELIVELQEEIQE